MDIKGLRGGVGKGVEETLRVRLWWDTSLIGGGDLQAMMLSYRLWNVSIDEVGCTSCACLFFYLIYRDLDTVTYYTTDQFAILVIGTPFI